MPTIDSFIKVASELSTLEGRKDQIDNDIENAKKVLQATVSESEIKSRDIIDNASAQAKAILNDVQDKQKVLAQRESDLAIREAAVPYIDSKIEELKVRERQLAKQEELLTERLAEAEASKSLWQTRQAELDAKDHALAEREAKLVPVE